MANEITLQQIRTFNGKYPKQIWSLFFSEMWERFCFYGMRGMLTFFMVSELFFKEDQASLQYGATQAFVYAFTFIGGLFADKILGFQRSLFWGGILMIIGSLILAYDPHRFFFLGIAFTVIGTGFFKPNISTMVGQLYNPGDERRDAGFSLFYAGINLGALIGGYLCIWLGKNYSWHWAFGCAAIVMTISLITFLLTRKTLGPIGLPPGHGVVAADGTPAKTPRPWYQYAVYVGSLLAIPLIMEMVRKPQYTKIFMYIVGPATLVYLFYEMTKVSAADRKKLLAALVFIIFSIIFWGIFEQSGGSLSLFAAANLNDNLLGLKLDPNGVNNSANSFFVIIFAFVVGLVWIALARRKMEPNTVVKFGLGLLFLAAAYFIFYATRFFQVSPGVASLNVFTLAYFVITLGELCLSPIGLSIMTKLSPLHLQGMMMGMWFLASAYGQYFAGLLGAGIAKAGENDTLQQKLLTYTDGYKQLGIYALIAGIILLILSPVVRRLMQEVK